jgi:hypothetical protein
MVMLSRRISWETQSLVYEYKQLCFDLIRDLIDGKLTWIPSHVGLVGNGLMENHSNYIFTTMIEVLPLHQTQLV